MNYVLITGASGGMGRAAAERFAANGYGVFALDRSECKMRENVFFLQTDVTNEASVRDAFDKVREQTDELCAIVHLAGMYRLDSLVEISPSEFEELFRVNLGGAYLVNKTFLPLLPKSSNVVIVTSELAVRDPLPFTGLYGVSKAALDRYAYSLRMELQLSGVNVSVLRAGAVDTGMIERSTSQLDEFCRKNERYACNAKRFRAIVDSVEARRISPQKVAEKLLRIVNAPKPKFAYAINRNPLLILFDFLPKRIRFLIISKLLKNPEKTKG